MAAPIKWIRVTIRSNERDRVAYFRADAIAKIEEVLNVLNNKSTIMLDSGLEFYLRDTVEEISKQLENK